MREKSAAGMARAEADSLLREVKADADRIKRRARGRRALRLGAKGFICIALAFILMILLPPFYWPIRGRVSSAFFFRLKPESASPLAIEFHRGLDIAAPSGTTIHSTAAGYVLEAGMAPDLGKYVLMRHFAGMTSVYAHLSRIDVAKGTLILLPGTRALGAVGSTGRSTGNHLHFAMRAGSVYLPPRPLLFFHSVRRSILGF